MKETKYYFWISLNPYSPNYRQKEGLFRTVMDHDKRRYHGEKYNEDTGEWIESRLVSGASGIGGGNNFEPATEDEAIEYMDRKR